MIQITLYIDKNGQPVTKGDILFYSESIPYAESIHLVEEIDGELYGRTVVGNWDGKYHKVDNDTPVNLKYYQGILDNSGLMPDAIKIGNKENNPEFMTVEYAEKNYPLTQYSETSETLNQ